MRQESRFQTKIKSPVGATGLMQVMPSTAAWIAPQMNADIKKSIWKMPMIILCWGLGT